MAYILLVLAIGMNVTAQLLLKYVAKQMQFFDVAVNKVVLIKTLLLQPAFWIALVSYGISFGLYLVVLSKLELSKAYPISSTAGIVLIVVISIFTFHEPLTFPKILGVGLGLLGILLLFK
ncbi:MAG: hypothetical protein A3B74_00605 [Candidatus Kerfeldbacteria bacterium RIFCSPHIGHO2_02_FULL_42_14]|uniref:EamA domain-containing protein n=1 Tax=Candidatus Kerfeldbacteria bacterium RIFCSPHIGHO2_02_FULL_42_14 TaxID=1798540 RepID=A0A1G2AQZ5_9BACT|nr:MAG: hypothetical protein A3B74_00605 [Candidatus Kerfeldbacteria bacterium RIFCSPHIGHO2_02_FULL_42_14]OGY81459.1 MAG: hypothetical protein A3E60_05540 [Candidatus Kerfeldbacteria bacterium RIFCSPHIGHO2_12_FULL_42_13]OGY83506.1 MAG: hypothetical protein A3I91_02570 [Candidatus Kerfeldbacteria bacterium RIFCSPLOWO2_02_FULL_42_19]OGY86967.1 MAG: hypothetical protein A3G01_01635 [Candidatus Kerfeldbacteria bacterium RIFCSPLOWO2_12_FULL_43_9]